MRHHAPVGSDDADLRLGQPPLEQLPHDAQHLQPARDTNAAAAAARRTVAATDMATWGRHVDASRLGHYHHARGPAFKVMSVNEAGPYTYMHASLHAAGLEAAGNSTRGRRRLLLLTSVA